MLQGDGESAQKLLFELKGVARQHLVPASTAVPAAAAKQQYEKHNDEKRGGIHLETPPAWPERAMSLLRMRSAATVLNCL